jgi:5-methylcytosine-specific restriction protein A
MIKEMIEKIFDEFPKITLEEKPPFKDNPLVKYLNSASKNFIKPVIKDSENLIFKSSPGQMNQWAAVPWVAVLDPLATDSIQDGHYITYLFSADMERVYLNLNQGITKVLAEFKSDAKNELHRRADILRKRVPEYKNFFDCTVLDLSSDLVNSFRPKNYEYGIAFGKVYKKGNLPEEQVLVNDINNMIDLYSTSISRGGTDMELAGEDFKPETFEKNKEVDLSELKKYSYHRRIERNHSNSKKVKDLKGYICEACGFDFKNFYGDIGEGFIEAHHNTKLADLPEGKRIKLDYEHDFSVLCSNCHRMVHKKNPPYTVLEIQEKIRKGKK